MDPAIQDFYDAIPKDGFQVGVGATAGLSPAVRRASAIAAQVTPSADGSLPYIAFSARHPTYAAPHWRRMRALYNGGRELLTPEMLIQFLARNNREPDELYAYRLSQAFYVNYCNEIIDYIVQTMASDPLRVLKDGEEPEDEADPIATWAKDVSPPAAQGTTPLNALALALVTEAMVIDGAWLLLDKPPIDDDQAAPRSLLEAEQQGLTRTCARVVPAEEVVHWEIDARTTRLRWALLCSVEYRYDDFYAVPTVVETYTRYDDTTFTQWVVSYKAGAPPMATDMIPPSRRDVHGFERCPLRRFDLPAGLQAMSKLESMARTILNKWCHLDIAERRSLLPTLYEFQGVEHGTKAMPVSIAQRDSGRATNTPRSAHHVQVRGKDDSAAFVGPSSEPFKASLESIAKLAQEMHRVMYQMSLATDGGSASATGRSGESKKEDRGASVVIATAVGALVVAFLRAQVPDVLHAAGGVTDAVKAAESYSLVGYQEFESVGADALVDETQILVSLAVPSQTAQIEVFMRLFRVLLKGGHPDVLLKIQHELAQNITAEQVAPAPPMPPIIPGAPLPGAEDGVDANGDPLPEPPVPGVAPPKAKGKTPSFKKAPPPAK